MEDTVCRLRRFHLGSVLCDGVKCAYRLNTTQLSILMPPTTHQGDANHVQLDPGLPNTAQHSLCNDIAVGEDGSVFVTNSAAPEILRLPPGSQRLEVWITDSLLQAPAGAAAGREPRGAGGFLAD